MGRNICIYPPTQVWRVVVSPVFHFTIFYHCIIAKLPNYPISQIAKLPNWINCKSREAPKGIWTLNSPAGTLTSPGPPAKSANSSYGRLITLRRKANYWGPPHDRPPRHPWEPQVRWTPPRLPIYACMHVCMYACVHVRMYACMHVCIYACMRVCTHAGTHVCMHAFMYIPIYQ